MARNIPITGIAGLMEKEIEHVVKIVALEWTAEVKEQTPVDWKTAKQLANKISQV